MDRAIQKQLGGVMLGLLALAALANDTVSDTNLMQSAKMFSFEKAIKAEVHYLLFLPKGFNDSPGKTWPLILFLHGAGERGNEIAKVAVHGPPKVAPHNPDFPFVIVSPQCPEGQVWSTEVLLGLLDHAIKNYAIDPNRVYLTGLSMGGYGTWDLGLRYPERFAAI